MHPRDGPPVDDFPFENSGIFAMSANRVEKRYERSSCWYDKLNKIQGEKTAKLGR